MPDRNPLVSILTTVYNRERFLGECIESVQRSKYQNYEHIIVDDRSTDESVSIAQHYAQKDERIKVFVNEENIGDYPNRNQAAKHASGKYIKYLDADDLHGPWVLNIMVDAMEQNPDAGVGLFFRGNGELPPYSFLLSQEQAFEAHYNKGIDIFNRSPLSAIIKRSAFHRVHGFPNLQHVGDHELWHRLASSFSVVAIPTHLAHYRIHDDQQSADNRADPSVPFKYHDAAIRGTTQPHNNILSDGVQKKVVKIVRRRQARTILVLLRRLQWATARRLKIQSRLTWTMIVRNAWRN